MAQQKQPPFVLDAKTWHKENFQRRLVGREVTPLAAQRFAAVAALVRFEQPGSPEILLMRRAKRSGDPWSGQVCFPGGKAEEQDLDLLGTAKRETEEELGFQLDQVAEYLGPLDPLRATSRGRIVPTVIEPFVFAQRDVPTMVLNSEADSTFWLPLGPAARGDFDSEYSYDAGRKVRFPAWRYQGHVIWGLTFQMLRSMLVLLQK